MREYAYLARLRQFSADGWDGNKKTIHMYPFDTWDHPAYGKTTITPEIATALKDSFDKNVKGTKLFADYEHGFDKAKGAKSAGEIISLEVRDDGLWGVVNFTDVAKKEIEDGEWNYWSTSHFDEWTHPHNKKTTSFVFNGGALTNTPWVKGMQPLNFSEILAEVAPEEMHDYGFPPDPTINDDDAADSGSRINTPPFVPDAPDPLIQNLNTVYNNDGSISVSLPNLTTDGTFQWQVGDIIRTDDNTAFPYVTFVPLAVPSEEEGGTMPTDAEVLAGIRTALGIGDDVDLVAHVTDMNGELEPLRELKKDSEQRKEFSEKYPDEFKRLQQLEVESRERYAREFSEKLGAKRFAKPTGDVDENGDAKLEVTTLGLSALAIEEIGGIAKKFSDRTATLDDFSNVMNTLLSGGLVDYGERGSTQGDPGDEDDNDKDVVPTNFQDARKMFSEKVNEIREADELELNAAIKLAAERYPELYKAYAAPPVVG